MADAALYLVRHGATAANDMGDERFRGTIDWPLAGDGIRTARAAARVLLPVQATRLYASPMTRALDTARIMSVTLGLTPERESDLLPWDIGTFSGRRIKEALEEMLPYQTTDRDTAPPGSHETFNQFVLRDRRTITRLLHQVRTFGESIIAVTHARLIYALEEIMFGRPIPYVGPPAPGGIVRLAGDIGQVMYHVVYAGREPRHVGVAGVPS